MKSGKTKFDNFRLRYLLHSDISTHITPSHTYKTTIGHSQSSKNIPDRLLYAAATEAMSTRGLHSRPQGHKANGALVLALQGRVELHIIALGLLVT